jgi:hypothetical protein
MSDDVGAIDAFAVAARAELSEVSERRTARAAAAADGGFTNIEAARIIGRVILLAAEKLGIRDPVDLDDLLQRILAGARHGGLDPLAYRVVWIVAHAARGEAAPSA